MSNAQKNPSWKKPDWFRPEKIDTIISAFPDVFGQLMGKRLTYDFFVNHVLTTGMHACNYLLTVDIDMNIVPGFKVANWDKGYGDFTIRPDMNTLRALPWQKGTALVLGDLFTDHGDSVEESPRQVLARQIERLAQNGYKAFMGSELEFYLYNETYRSARAKGYRDLVHASDYAIDYHVLQPSQDEDVLRRLRNEMTAAGIPVECSKGETGRGQHEVNLLYADAMEMADRHVIYKAGSKEIATQQEKAISFMAKTSQQDPGNGFHIHTSLWDSDGKSNLFYDADNDRPSKFFDQFLAGLLKYSRELTYFFAPTINSYKRFQINSWAPTAIVCGHDNRTCGYRIVGHGSALRIENRMPCADANPYLAFAATIAAGLAGVDENLTGPDIYHGNAYADTTLPRLPKTLDEATDLLANSKLALDAFGPDVVEFYVHTARAEIEAFRQTVTDWEYRRYFELL